MNQREQEQLRLDTRARAFADAASLASHAASTGQDPLEELRRLEVSASRAAGDHRAATKKDGKS